MKHRFLDKQNIIKKYKGMIISSEKKNSFKNDFSEIIKTGNLIEILYSIQEGEKERIQRIEGIIIGKSQNTFRILRYIGKIKVEQIFYKNSPKITTIQLIQKAKVRRAKIFYLQTAKGKSAKLKKVI